MLIEVINVVTIQRNGHPIKGRRCKCKCDFCDKELIRPYKCRKQQYFFCDQKCQIQSQKNGVLKEKNEQTMLVHYGVKHSFQSPIIRERITQTLRDRYDVDFVSQIEEVKIKKEKTFNERYGAPYFLQSNILRSRLEQRMLIKHGFKNALEHGSSFREKIDFVENARKAHETKKLNGTYKKSQPEDDCYELLCKNFGVENVERQHYINQWSIDFYVSTIDTYIQCDGVYWHGLDRSFEEIAQHKTKCDKQIHKKMLTDIEQGRYFEEHNLKLVRITDIELYANPTILIERIGVKCT